MEVLKSDFEAKLPLIEQALIEADFIAIDTEFTGLTTPDVQFQATDDLNTRYHKLKHCVQEFTIIQYGVCAFKRTATGDFEAKPFNFYIFGADTHDIQSRRVFSATPSSLSFLRSNKFDFNKLIEEGIPFYNYSEENSMFQSNQGKSMMTRHTMIRESSLTKSGRSFLDYNRNNIKKWLQSNSEKPLVVQVNSTFYRRLIYQEIQDSRYNGYLHANTRDSRHIEIHRLKDEDRSKKANMAPKLNFRAVIELIQKAQCPVVAHNAAFDILHTVDQFWHYLPEEVGDFKEMVNSMWPHVVDTKYLAEYHPRLKSCFNTSVLGSLFNTVYEELQEAGQHVGKVYQITHCLLEQRTKRSIVMGEGFDRYEGAENETAHEAGYDAYMTGVIYLAFMAFIRENEEKAPEESSEEKTSAEKRKREDSDENRLNTHKKFRQDGEEENDEEKEEQKAESDSEEVKVEVEDDKEEDEVKEDDAKEDDAEEDDAEEEDATEEDATEEDAEELESEDEKVEEDKEDDNEEDDSEEESDDDEEGDDASMEEGEVDPSDSDSDESEIELIRKKKENSFFLNESVKPYYGRIFLMRSDIPYINLKGDETIEMINYPNRFYLHNIPDGMSNAGIERLYPSIQPIAVSWVNSNNAWIILKDESKIPLVKLGILGLSVVQSFLPGCSRQVEGEAYGITKEAGQMELITHERWRALYGPKPTVNYNNHASISNHHE
ncbi:Poly(A)-specific ribonuclease PARN [Choanephora cucurbitarum]|uniref:Poly(A)-specific ribonuclease PARN n=1 Tax=Choanephora cucurbitarum TaxID=101091 RepID=A0A1C7N4S3_9FUNG|nr:Poly(A)-specific ribonuclease PARN [Choanephora cucurbitarum]